MIERILIQEDTLGYTYISFFLTEEGKTVFENATAEIAERGINEEDYSNQNYIKLHYGDEDVAQATIESAVTTGQGSVRTTLEDYEWRRWSWLSITSHTPLR